MSFFFRFERDHFRIEYVAFTLMRGNSKSDNESLKRSRIALKRKMTMEKTTRHCVQLFLLQNLLKFTHTHRQREFWGRGSGAPVGSLLIKLADGRPRTPGPERPVVYVCKITRLALELFFILKKCGG